MNSIKGQWTEEYLNALLAGDRGRSRQIIESASADCTAIEILGDLVWPTMELLQGLYRDDRITLAGLNLATRLNRSISEQLASRLEHKPSNGKKVLIFCGNQEPEELGGQLTADLFEADGWCVKFAGGGVPDDEVLQLIGQVRPDLLIMFATLPAGVPGVRKLIDYLREVNSCPQMQIMCCGGIYRRAEGLAEEIGADLYAPDAITAIAVARENPERRAMPEQQTVGRSRRVRRAGAPPRRTMQVVRVGPPHSME